MIVIGIDPGKTGAVAILNGQFVTVWDMPAIDKWIDCHTLIERFWANTPKIGEYRAFLERAQFMAGGHGRQAMTGSPLFNYGVNYGTIRTALAAAEIPFEEVSPAKWKRALRLSKEKDIARRRASELMPFGSDNWPLKSHHNRAEAALIAWWGREKINAGT